MPRGSNSKKSSGGSKNARKTSSTPRSSSGGGRSNYSYMKDFGGFNKFMGSYGLKVWDHDDIQEGKVILDAFREADKSV